MTEAALLEVKDLSIWRGENLLVDELSFRIDPGSIVQIQGMNGSGKTTLLRALIGLAEYDEGHVLWRGRPMPKSSDEMHSDMLYLGHKSGISPGLTPLENLISLCPELGVDCRRRVMPILEELSIEDRIDLPSAALSAGQKRRVTLCRLRLQSASLWVLDEPLTSLDADGLSWVKREIEQQVKSHGSVVFTTHQNMLFEGLKVQTVVLGREQ